MMDLSVIIPAFNEEQYIEKTLIALRNQTLKDFEIIVKDGESRDKTVGIAEKHADNVISKRDVSVGDARNQGASCAKGNVLVFVDADTQLPPYALERVVKLMKTNKDVVGGSCRKILDDGNILNRLMYELVNISTFLSFYLRIGGAHGNCMYIKKSVFRKIGGFNPKIKVAEEQELVRRAMRFGKFAFLLDLCVLENSRRIKKWGKLKLYMSWLIGTFKSFKIWEKQTYEKVR
jgi:glycosyltransferase involved in cell wall biosynthesis